MADGLLDTTVLIDFFRGDQAAFDVLQPIFAGRRTASYSPVTVFELWLGVRTHEEEIALFGILGVLERAPLTDIAARTAAMWLRGVSPRRAEAMFRDALIAASATERGEPVITRNTSDFQRFPVDVQSY